MMWDSLNTAYYKKDNIIIYCEDVLSALKKLPDESIDMVMTSPPYYGLRTYGVEGQIGLEKTFEKYMQKILAITAEIKRILKPIGSLWLNLGDCYGGNLTGSMPNPNSSFRSLRTQEAQMQAQEARKLVEATDNNRMYKSALGRLKQTAMSKCLLMQPERIALAMIDQQGWILRNKIKWVKQIYIHKQRRTMGSVMPTSVKDRFKESGEELYFFVKSKKYYFDLDNVRIPNQVIGITDMRDAGILRQRMYNGSKYNQFEFKPSNFVDVKMYKDSKYNQFNYRVRDAKRKEGQPQFKASEEEIKNYGLRRDWRIEEKQGYDMGSVNPHRAALRGGLKLRGLGEKDTPNKKRDKKCNRSALDWGYRLYNPQGKNLPTCWLIQSEPHNFSKELNATCDHFAAYPQALCEIPIKAGCPKDGIVLDPFAGSGTSGIVAQKLGRKFIGIELSQKYVDEIMIPRLEKEKVLL